MPRRGHFGGDADAGEEVTQEVALAWWEPVQLYKACPQDSTTEPGEAASADRLFCTERF